MGRNGDNPQEVGKQKAPLGRGWVQYGETPKEGKIQKGDSQLRDGALVHQG
jgi:hypothetical protein